LTSELHIVNRHEEHQQRLRREERMRLDNLMREEEERYQRKLSRVEKGSDAYFEIIMDDYAENLKKNNRQRRGDNKPGLYGQKTEGAHAFDLCQACKMGVCQYFKKLTKKS